MSTVTELHTEVPRVRISSAPSSDAISYADGRVRWFSAEAQRPRRRPCAIAAWRNGWQIRK
jgi:hypothetical protein